MSDENTQHAIEDIAKKVDGIVKNPPMPDHEHNGFDVTRVNFGNIYQKKIWVQHTVFGLLAATATNYGVFFIVQQPCVLTKFQEVHQTAGTNGGAVTLMLEKLTSTQAPDAGVDMLAATLSLKATANTVQTGTITSISADRTLKAGDRLCLEDAGTLTDVANVTVVVELTLT